MHWLAQNWGNLTSLVGLVVSLYTLWLARRIRDVVEGRVGRYRRSEVVEHLAEARTLCQSLAKSRTTKLRGETPNRLRNCLAAIVSQEMISTEDRETLRIAIAELRAEPDNDEDCRAWMRKLEDSIQEMLTRMHVDTTRPEN